ncbi:AI-2E family transporter [Leptolyngbya sp. 7M]|uniref:AI-2E family transporter n=1 Tax=Leptolyngbya sp. NK1-12 TaxID=2547451 RepID=A0AA97AJ93_9CYAN|nr:AI-2E family transporter [Leptolyngbya sp. 7M]MBF2047931.1 AI-2E family transporter [Elainella sp. C42_A2020_010]QYO63596.1 AI-2E family transporter [Leptolyngbya sp. 7M]WNZ22547.1 AI-2E family transporter [Leptolyngbya sp. NK1-12]
MFQFANKLPRWYGVGLAFPLIFLNGWLLLLLVDKLEPLVSILITATLIAFLLDYPIRFLEQLGAKRGIAIGLVFLLFLLLLVLLVLVLGPLIIQQANELLTRLPDWIESGKQQVKTVETWAKAQQLPIDVSSAITQSVDRLTIALRSFTRQLVNLIFNTIGSIVNVFLTVVLSVFLVLRGQELWNGVLGWLPASWNLQVREYLPDNFERYIAGQATLAAILASVQTIALFIMGVPLALLFGFTIGAASLVPFGGTLGIITVSLLASLQSVWLGAKVLVVCLIVNQISENVIGPRIVGEMTGLNPVWMLISVFIGFKLKGALGLFIAVPIASFIKGTADRIRTSKTVPPLLALPEETTPVESGATPSS